MLKIALFSAAVIGAAGAAAAQDASAPPPPPAATPDMSAAPAPAMPDAGMQSGPAAPAPDATASAPPPPPSDAGPVTPATAVAGTVSWAGLYAGLNGGWGFDSGKRVTDAGVTPNNFTALAANVRPSQLTESRSGFVGGGQVGYNFVFNDKFVIGAEGVFDYMDSEGTTTFQNLATQAAFPGRRTYLRTRLNWMGSARGRAGYALSDSGMFYVTGGYAFGRVKGRAEFDGVTNSDVNYAGGHSYLAQGWTAGGGLEFRPFSQGMMSKITIGIEGTYYDLGRSHIVASQTAAAPGAYVLGLSTRGYNGVARINYHF